MGSPSKEIFQGSLSTFNKRAAKLPVMEEKMHTTTIAHAKVDCIRNPLPFVSQLKWLSIIDVKNVQNDAAKVCFATSPMINTC